MISRFPQHLIRTLSVAVVTAVMTHGAGAQTEQRYSFQSSILATSIGVGTAASTTGGIGVEPQLRISHLWDSRNLGSVSIGLGGQWSRYTAGPDELTITGAFFEPRLVWRSKVLGIYPYAAGRIALLQQTSNFGTSSRGTGFGVGGGIFYPVTSRVNLDAGVSLIRPKFGNYRFNYNNKESAFRPFNTYAAKVGVSIGIGQ